MYVRGATNSLYGYRRAQHLNNGYTYTATYLTLVRRRAWTLNVHKLRVPKKYYRPHAQAPNGSGNRACTAGRRTLADKWIRLLNSLSTTELLYLLQAAPEVALI
jgi:hypothetical protein